MIKTKKWLSYQLSTLRYTIIFIIVVIITIIIIISLLI